MVQQQPVKVLNVAEKPSVARALADVFSRLPGARGSGMQRDVHPISTHENVHFPSVYSQGDGRMIQGPSKLPWVFVIRFDVSFLISISLFGT
jgi:DNA topoisomerase-3